MTAEENLLILQKMLSGIDNNNINDVMSELGYEVVKSTDKSTEWVLIEPEIEIDESEKVYDQHMKVLYTDKSVRILRFASTDVEKDFIKYVRENDNVESVKTVDIEPERTYK